MMVLAPGIKHFSLSPNSIYLKLQFWSLDLWVFFIFKFFSACIVFLSASSSILIVVFLHCFVFVWEEDITTILEEFRFFFFFFYVQIIISALLKLENGLFALQSWSVEMYVLTKADRIDALMAVSFLVFLILTDINSNFLNLLISGNVSLLSCCSMDYKGGDISKVYPSLLSYSVHNHNTSNELDYCSTYRQHLAVPNDSRRAISYKNGWQMTRQNAEVWSSTEETTSPKRKSRSCDHLLTDDRDSFPDAQAKSESMGSLLCEEDAKEVCSMNWASPYAPEGRGGGRARVRHRSAHDAPGFLKMYKKMHRINRKDLMNSEVICSVKSRILQYEKEQHKGILQGWRESSTEEVPRDMVPTRISEFEKLIQKSKSMPNLGDEMLSNITLEPPKNGLCSQRRFSIESLLEEENEVRHPSQVQRSYKSKTLVPIHIEVTSDEPQRSHMDFSDSDQDGVVSDLSDFIQIEGSSFCSESDFDHYSFTSSESFYGSGHHHHHHHHHHRHLISSCKGRCPASYTRFTTMLKHERAKQEPAEDPRRQEAESGLSKIAFLVSPVPFRRKKSAAPKKQTEKTKRKSSVFEALDSALKDICDQIKAEKRRGSLPDNSILHRLITELLPDIPERNSSLTALKKSPMHQPFHPLPQDGATHCPLYQNDCGRLPLSASLQDMDTTNNNNQENDSALCFQGGFTFFLYPCDLFPVFPTLSHSIFICVAYKNSSSHKTHNAGRLIFTPSQN